MCVCVCVYVYIDRYIYRYIYVVIMKQATVYPIRLLFVRPQNILYACKYTLCVILYACNTLHPIRLLFVRRKINRRQIRKVPAHNKRKLHQREALSH